DVVGHGLEFHEPVRSGRTAMRLQIHADDAIARCEELDIRPEHLDRSETPVQEDERIAATELLVAELDSVYPRQIGSCLHCFNAPRRDSCSQLNNTNPNVLVEGGPVPNRDDHGRATARGGSTPPHDRGMQWRGF